MFLVLVSFTIMKYNHSIEIDCSYHTRISVKKMTVNLNFSQHIDSVSAVYVNQEVIPFLSEIIT